MHRVVYKYIFTPELGYTHTTLDLPVDSKFVLFGMQYGQFAAWYEVNSELDVPKEEVKLYIVGTGSSIPNNATHLASHQDLSTGYVWHLYEGSPEPS